MYQLDIRNFTEGVIKDKSSQPLSSRICFEIGKRLHDLKMYDLAIRWFNEAVRKSPSPEIGANIYKTKALSETKLNRPHEARKSIHEIKKLAGDYKAVYEIYKEMALGRKINQEDELIYENTWEYELQRKSCRDEISPSPEQQKDLKCKLKSGPHYSLKLAPLKMEELSKDPYVAVFHNVISNNEVETVINLSKSRITESQIYGSKDVFRISKSTFIEYDEHRDLMNILRRVGYATDSDIEGAESIQVVNYGLGGYYKTHVDPYVNEPLSLNNRIGTALFYV